MATTINLKQSYKVLQIEETLKERQKPKNNRSCKSPTAHNNSIGFENRNKDIYINIK